jgi:two-component system, OmpR family, sensor histidine kinase KdpD
MADERQQPILLRERPSRKWGVAAAIGAVAITTAAIYPLRQITPAVSNGVVYLLAVLLISTYWGAGLGVLTAVGSATTFNFFHIPPTGRFTIADAQNWVALGVFLVAAVAASQVSELARSRAAEADLRRREADLAAEMARLLLGGLSLDDSLGVASQRLAQALELPWASIELGKIEADARRVAFPMRPGAEREATLLVPAAIAPEVRDRLRQRIVPALEALVGAALDRDALQQELVATEAIRRSDVVKTALLRAVSHDLRTPLTAILAAADAVRSPSVGAGERDELGGEITAEASRLSRLVDKLLDLSRLQAGAAEPRRDWCSIDEVLRAAVDELGADGDFELAIEGDLPLLRADAVQLERAFVNLLENGRRYSSGLPVTVRASSTGDRITVRVVDHGPGIASAELGRIFEPFYRASDGSEHDGSGLGLAIVKGFVEANGGKVSARSLPGQGTTFVVDLPVPEGGRVPLEPQRA